MIPVGNTSISGTDGPLQDVRKILIIYRLVLFDR